MKKIFTFLALVLCYKANAQQTYWPSSPPGWNSAGNISFRSKASSPDSLSSFLLFNPLTGKYYQVYTSAQSNRRYVGPEIKDSLIVRLPDTTAMKAYNGRAKFILLTDTLMGGGTPFANVSTGTIDHVVTFAATAKGGYWIRQYNKGAPIDMRWGGFSASKSASANKAIVNAYLAIYPKAFIKISTAYLPIDSLTITNNTWILDLTTGMTINGGHLIGKGSSSGSVLAFNLIGLNGASHLYNMPYSDNLPDSANTAKIDLFNVNFNKSANTTSYRVGYMQLFNRFDLGQNGETTFGSRGFGNNFGINGLNTLGFDDGSSTGGKTPFKQQQYDIRDTINHKPFRGDWRANKAYVSGQFIVASNHLYKATTTGTSGSTVPSHTSGTISDGGVSWLFKFDYSGSESANSIAINILASRTQLGPIGANVPLTLNTYLAGDLGIKNNTPMYWFDNTSTPIWTLNNGLNSTDLTLTSSNGTNAFVRYNQTKNFIQYGGLSFLPASRTISDNSTTPNVDSLMVATFNNGSPTVITDFVGEPGQVITVQSSNGNTSIANSATITLLQSENLVLSANSSIVFQANASRVWRQNGPAIATATTGGSLSSGTQSWLGNKTNLGTFDVTLSTTGTQYIRSTNANGGSAATASVSASNGTVEMDLLIRGTGFTTNANRGYVSLTGSANMGFLLGGNERMTITNAGNLGVRNSAPSAALHLPAGTSTAGTGPLKLTSGTNLATAEVGSIEYDGSDLFYTVTGPTRRTVANLAGTQTFLNKTLTTPIITDGGGATAAIAVGTGSGANFIGYSASRAMFGYNNSTSNASITASSAKGFEVWVNSTGGSFGAGTLGMTITSAGAITGTTLTTPKLTGYTVAGLPAGTTGMLAYVTDALTPASLAIVVGGGAQTVPVFYNGTNWIVQ